MASTMNIMMGVDLLLGIDVSMLFGGGDKLNSAQNNVRIAINNLNKKQLDRKTSTTCI